MTNTEKLLSILEQGKERAVSRESLAERMDMQDRRMRAAVSCAIAQDYVPICNDQDGKGYYLPQNADDIRRQYYQTLHRGQACFAKLKAYREAMGQDGQITLDELIFEVQ